MLSGRRDRDRVATPHARQERKTEAQIAASSAG